MSELLCKLCECKMHLDYINKIIKTPNGKKIGFYNMPILMCGSCGTKRIPYMTNELITCVSKCENEEINLSDKDVNEELTISEGVDSDVVWYDFDKIKEKILQHKFISEKVKFIYDKDDYYFIPGLIRPWNIGFLTPVFFNIEVLLKYIYHPAYGLDIGADTFGYVYKADQHYISFGINENNKIIMWLGDIQKLPVEEQFYLRSENILSDHCISSEFYEAEIEVKWAERSAEKTLLQKRLEFNESVRNKFGFAISQLDTETLQVAKNISKLLVNTNDAFQDLIIPLNELFVESINNKEIRAKLKEQHPEIKDELKDKKGIKLLQLWLEKNTQNLDINAEISPLFVLYDLRLVSAHLYPDEAKEQILDSCCERLGLNIKERNYITIASTLIEKLTIMYTKFYDNLNNGNVKDSE